MDSILQSKDSDVCYLCHMRGTSQDTLDWHHVFGGAYRKKSERYGLKVKLHHSKCHIFGQKAVHNDIESARRIQGQAQIAAMEKYGWSKEEFIAVFGRNYLQE